jgi:hypothetical protein
VGETALILKQCAYRGTDLVVIPQPDGSVACIPAWITHESAAQLKVCVEPHLSLDVLRAHARVDVGLGLAGKKASPTRGEAAGIHITLL